MCSLFGRLLLRRLLFLWRMPRCCRNVSPGNFRQQLEKDLQDTKTHQYADSQFHAELHLQLRDHKYWYGGTDKVRQGIHSCT